MIKAINDQRLIMLCNECGRESVISLDALLAGTDRDPNTIVLSCPDCPKQAMEFLNRTWDNPGSHARLVNSLHARLVKAGKTTPGQRERLTEEPKENKPLNAEELSSSDLLLSRPSGDQAG